MNWLNQHIALWRAAVSALFASSSHADDGISPRAARYCAKTALPEATCLPQAHRACVGADAMYQVFRPDGDVLIAACRPQLKPSALILRHPDDCAIAPFRGVAQSRRPVGAERRGPTVPVGRDIKAGRHVSALRLNALDPDDPISMLNAADNAFSCIGRPDQPSMISAKETPHFPRTLFFGTRRYVAMP